MCGKHGTYEACRCVCAWRRRREDKRWDRDVGTNTVRRRQRYRGKLGSNCQHGGTYATKWRTYHTGRSVPLSARLTVEEVMVYGVDDVGVENKGLAPKEVDGGIADV